MKTKKSIETKSNQSVFFKFKNIGDSVSGILKDFVATQYGICLKLETKKQFVLVSLNNLILKKLFSDNFSRFKKGEKIRIVFTGIDGRTKLFDVTVGQTKLEHVTIFKTATQEELESFIGL